MQNIKNIIKVRKQMGAYFLDLATGKTKPLNFKDLFKKYHLWHQVVVRNLGETYFSRSTERHEVFVYLNKERKKEVQHFIKNVAPHLVEYKEKYIIEMLCYCFNSYKKK